MLGSVQLSVFLIMFTIIFINDADADVLNLAVSTPTLGSLIGYDGGSLAALGFPVASGVTGSDAKGAWDLTSGSLTPAVPAVPEPPSTLVLLTALGAFAVLLGTRLVARRTAPC
jgi:hypothetical protein